MNKKPRILIVEDEPAIRSGLLDVFIFHGYDVDCAADGDAGLRKSLSGTYDMILLDVMLPGVDGFEICNQVRDADRDQPIIMLTAKTEDEDIIHGLKLGADDYVAKPFSVAQLVARVEAVLRRSGLTSETPDAIELSDGTRIDVRNLNGKREGTSFVFTRREMDILEYLAANTERPVSRDELLNKVWGYARGLDLETRTVDIHIAKLRRKIESQGGDPQHLITVRGAGYRLLVS